MISYEVGISAFNEESNIREILKDISKQKTNQFRLKQVLLISDGSTDSTVDYAKSLNLKKIKIIEGKKREGKSHRLTELFKMASADWLVLLDADVLLKDNKTIYNLLLSGLKNDATLIGGNPKKINTGTYTDRVMNVSAFLQEYIKEHLDGGNNVYSCHGRIMAINKNHIKNIPLPIMTIGNDAYIYFSNLNSGGKFIFASNSVVLYKMPQTFTDFAKQERRFGNTRGEQFKRFGDVADNEFSIGIELKIKAIILAILQHGLWVMAYILYKLAAKIYGPDASVISNGLWNTAETTKKLE
jgi:glycosyltransferase involved in cell wall biosynthesis